MTLLKSFQVPSFFMILIACNSSSEAGNKRDRGEIVQDPDGSGDAPPVDTNNESIDFGNGVVLGNIDSFSIGYYEPSKGICDPWSQMWTVPGNNDQYPQFNLYISFKEQPETEYTVDYPSDEKDSGENHEQTSWTDLSVDWGNTLSSHATSGTVRLDIDPIAGTVLVSLSDLVFKNHSITEGASSDIVEGEVYSGEVLLDLNVSCNRVSTSSDGTSCGWDTAIPPYTNSFCIDATSEYSADVLVY